MNFSHRITAIDSHNAGEPMRLITGGVPFIPGKDMAAKQQYFQHHYDDIRRMVMHEPRGHSDMFGGVLCEPTREEAQLGVIFFDAGSYYHMCGHGAMAIARMAVETGLVQPKEPVTRVVLDTSAGLVELWVDYQGKETGDVIMDSNPSFLYGSDLTLHLSGLGSVDFELAFGGNFFALVDVTQFHRQIEERHIGFFLTWGMGLMEAINQNMQVEHPTYPHIQQVTDVMFYQSLGPQEGKNVVILGKGQFDRSPCGTGTASRVATLYQQGRLKRDQKYTHRSIIDSYFTAWVKEEVQEGGEKGVIVSIQSRPFITGFSDFVFSRDDPFYCGFLLPGIRESEKGE